MMPTDHDMAERVEQALDSLRRDPAQQPDTWVATWSMDLPAEALPLLQTLAYVEQACSDWRSLRHEADSPQPTAAFVGPPCERTPVPSRIGRYEVLRRLGAGGMGAVFLARDSQLGRLVAVKVPHLGRGEADRLAVQRFLREARSAATVSHPHICPLYDVGEDQGRPYAVMAYVEGESLDARLSRIGRFADPREAVALARQIVAALTAVHQHGMVHRDLKPANVLLDRDGKAVLTDFGLARAVEGHEQFSVSGAVVGTPAYMAPEQAAGDTGRIGPAADLYALGVVVYRMVTGRLPFEGQMLTIMGKLADEAPLPPSRHRADVPADLERIILRLLAKAPADRYPDAASVDADLAAFPAGSVESGRGRWRGRALTSGAAVACLAAAALVVVANGRVAPTPRPGSDTEPAAVSGPTAPGKKSPLPVARLTADLELSVWNDVPGARKQGMLGLPGSVPVRPGETLRIRAEASESAHLYLLLIDGTGKVNPLHPWNPALGFRPPPFIPLPGPPAAVAGTLGMLCLGPAQCPDRPTSQLDSPASLSHGWEFTGPQGYHLVLLLARRTPLPEPEKLQESIGTVERVEDPRPDLFDWVCVENERLFQIDPLRKRSRGPKVRVLGDPLVRVLTNLHAKFETVHGVRFACISK